MMGYLVGWAIHAAWPDVLPCRYWRPKSRSRQAGNSPTSLAGCWSASGFAAASAEPQAGGWRAMKTRPPKEQRVSDRLYSIGKRVSKEK